MTESVGAGDGAGGRDHLVEPGLVGGLRRDRIREAEADSEGAVAGLAIRRRGVSLEDPDRLVVERDPQRAGGPDLELGGQAEPAVARQGPGEPPAGAGQADVDLDRRRSSSCSWTPLSGGLACAILRTRAWSLAVGSSSDGKKANTRTR